MPTMDNLKQALGSPYNWTRRQFMEKLYESFISPKKHGTLNLDVERADAANIQQIIKWAEEEGYRAEEKPESEIVTVYIDRRPGQAVEP